MTIQNVISIKIVAERFWFENHFNQYNDNFKFI